MTVCFGIPLNNNNNTISRFIFVLLRSSEEKKKEKKYDFSRSNSYYYFIRVCITNIAKNYVIRRQGGNYIQRARLRRFSSSFNIATGIISFEGVFFSSETFRKPREIDAESAIFFFFFIEMCFSMNFFVAVSLS